MSGTARILSPSRNETGYFFIPKAGNSRSLAAGEFAASGIYLAYLVDNINQRDRITPVSYFCTMYMVLIYPV